MDTFLAIVVSGMGTSGIYALMAIGVTLIFGVGRVINFAHGAFYTLGAYFAYTYYDIVGAPLVPAIVLAIVTVAIFAILFDRYFIDPLRGNLIIVWMMTFALAFVVREALILIFGAQPRSIPPLIDASVDLLGQTISTQRILIVVFSLGAIVMLWMFLSMTRIGKGLQAVAQHRNSAQLVGIPIKQANAIVMGISAGLAAFAGIMITPIAVATPDMGLDALMMAFTVVIFGGIGSIKGTIIAALIIGYANTIISFLINPQLVTIGALIVVFSVVLLRPTGLFGFDLEERG